MELLDEVVVVVVLLVELLNGTTPGSLLADIETKRYALQLSPPTATVAAARGKLPLLMGATDVVVLHAPGARIPCHEQEQGHVEVVELVVEVVVLVVVVVVVEVVLDELLELLVVEVVVLVEVLSKTTKSGSLSAETVTKRYAL